MLTVVFPQVQQQNHKVLTLTIIKPYFPNENDSLTAYLNTNHATSMFLLSTDNLITMMTNAMELIHSFHFCLAPTNSITDLGLTSARSVVFVVQTEQKSRQSSLDIVLAIIRRT